MSRDAFKRERISQNGEFVCRRDFTCSGHRFQAGDSFDWRKLSLAERRVLMLWDGRYIAPRETIEAEEVERKVKAEQRAMTDAGIVAAITKQDSEAEKIDVVDAENMTDDAADKVDMDAVIEQAVAQINAGDYDEVDLDDADKEADATTDAVVSEETPETVETPAPEKPKRSKTKGKKPTAADLDI